MSGNSTAPRIESNNIGIRNALGATCWAEFLVLSSSIEAGLVFVSALRSIVMEGEVRV
jgi:hypothetical protein